MEKLEKWIQKDGKPIFFLRFSCQENSNKLNKEEDHQHK